MGFKRTRRSSQTVQAGDQFSVRSMAWSTQQALGRLSAHLLLAAVGLFYIFPFFWLISTSFKELPQIFTMPPTWIPNPIRWRNYTEALSYFPFLRQLRNTLFVACTNVCTVVCSSSLVAYSFSRLRWKFRDICFALMLATMMLPYQVTMIPLFTIFRRLGWVNTFLPLLIGGLFGSPFFIFLLRQFFLTIPKELDDAATIDGCTEIMIFFRIILPLAKPALATVALFQFLGSWNDFLGPLIYLNDPQKYTLSLGIQVFVSTTGIHWGYMMAATTVLTVPVVILFFFTQRTFIQGIALTGVKG